MPKYCSECGAKLVDGRPDCPACGKRITDMVPVSESAGITPNLASALSYIWIAAIIFLLTGPYNRNKEIRFHAFQGLFVTAVWFAGHLVLNFIPLLGWVLLPVWSLATTILSIVCAVKAYKGNRLLLPVISDMAQQQADQVG